MQIFSSAIDAATWSLLVTSVMSEVANYKVTSWKSCPESGLRSMALEKLTVGECVYECNVRPLCTSAGYRRLEQLCEIFSSADVTLVLNTRQRPCVFISKTDIEYRQNQNTCSCTTGEVCDRTLGHCVIKECPPLSLLANGELLGNLVHVGATLNIVCDEGFSEDNSLTSVVCEPTGAWSHVPHCSLSKCPVNGNEWVHPDGMSSFKIRIYTHDSKKTHEDAKLYCLQSESGLVRIDSEEKNNYVVDILTACLDFTYTNYWIDGSNNGDDNSMTFSNGDAMPLGTTFWQTDRPEIYPDNEMCVKSQRGDSFLWRDSYCSEEAGFICEKIH